MRVLIAGGFTFPSGAATASRIRNLAFGLRDCGAEVHVVTMAPTLLSPDIVLKGGSPYQGVIPYQGITYECPGGRPAPVGTESQDRSSGLRLRNPLWGKPVWFARAYTVIVPAYRRVARRLAEHRYDLFFAYDRGITRTLPLVRLCRRHGAACILDVVEIPASFDGLGGILSPVYWDWFLGAKVSTRQFDGLTVIATGLEQRFAARGFEHIQILPSIEGWDDLPTPQPGDRSLPFRLLYLGALLPRDAPEMLFETMRLLHRRGLPVQLDVVGRFASSPDGRRLADLARQDPLLQACVNLVGEVDDADLAARLGAADGLVLLRRDAPTEVCSFPTRLIEYLKQGRPVFVSDVGDVSRYLRHGQDAVLLPPGDPAGMAAAIEALVNSPDRGYALGLQGQRRGQECFDRKTHAAQLLAYAARLRESRTRGD
jgi:glycosyltransferase involved in cell wall biosynthesis